ncbi:mechanosensitive ion channel family protein [Sulfurivermis fontis]|uniref:mechanosensitive ion channel family protein n=1 Tax=Sulfurivermis fontis TaxID=1972068 RepID=UPI000FD7C5FF|nr:mechanosensitive ion channel family protein [Sulfurivermis fontis]
MEWIEGFDWLAALRAGIILLVGWGLAKVASLAAGRAARRYTAAQETMLVQRIVFYGVLALSVVTALQQMGFNLGVLLGAAGILTVAVGFASQTSASNLISGLFLIGERAFVVGDTIKVGNTTGEVLSIDLLSVKLRTPDNLFVRVPNETMIKAEITNLTRFPVRRLDLLLGVNYKEDMGKVQRVLQEVAERNPLCLTEPAPLFIFTGFGDSAMNLQFSVWAVRENFLELRNTIQQEIKQAFDANGIDIPYPQRVLHLAEPVTVRQLP